MTSAIRLHVLAAVALTGLSLSAPAQAQQANMSFFVTSVGKGNGADLGGLAGADAHCQALAKAAGSTETNWRAYLSTTEPGGVAGVNARDRIGKGPWQNAKGVVVAKSVEDLARTFSRVQYWSVRPWRATRAVVTEYDMKRPTTQPHDVLLDKDSDVWYSDFGELFISKFDPKTLKLTEYPTKEFKPGAPVGNLSLEFDKEGKLWFDTMHQGAIGTMDPNNGEIKYYPLPPEWNDNRVQLNFVGLRHDVDGKVWTKSVGTVDVFRLDLVSGKWERFHPTDSLPPGHRYSIYQLISDSNNNVWMAEFEDGYLGKIDAKTLKVTWFPLPSPHGRARRMEIDDQDRILVTEYRANKVALFDTKTEQFTEYDVPPLTFPYRAEIDKNGELWTGGMSSDRVVRVDPKTGTVVEYLMPSGTNMRTVYVDNSTTPVTFWVGSNHAHALVKVEPLD